MAKYLQAVLLMDRILETERLYLRGLNHSDSDTIVKMYGDIEVMRYIGLGTVVPEVSARKTIERWIEYEKQYGFTNWAVVEKKSECFIGTSGFNWLPDNSDIEITYILDKPYWGKGYATEIASEVLKYGFGKLGLKRIVGMVYPENKNSARV